MIFVEGCPEAKSVSVLLRGGTEHVVDEVKRAFEDAIGVVAVAHEDGAVLTGGGSVIAAISRDLRSWREGIGGREQMAIEAFSSALEVIPRTLAENAGLDPVNTIIDLRKATQRESQLMGKCISGRGYGHGKGQSFRAKPSR